MSPVIPIREQASPMPMPKQPAAADTGLKAPPGVPLSLYIHLPWCVSKCPYCDFNSHALPSHQPDRLDEGLQQAYVDALLADLEQALPMVWGRRIQTIFVGGGTPNLFSAREVNRLLVGVRERLPLAPGLEVTLEANPAAAQRAEFEALRQAGVTRLSLGIQSFSDGSLQALGRAHSAGTALQAAQDAVEVFERVNLDLMYGLPGQSVEDALRDLTQALAVGMGHLSLYQLTLEPNTLFAVRPPVLPDEDTLAEMQDALLDRLQQQGLARYEVSAYARTGERCQHNLNYWQFGDYLGIGAGAHSKLSLPDQGIVRQTCIRRPEDYLRAAREGAARRTERVEADALPFEFMLNATRLVDGFAPSLYSERTAQPLEDLLPAAGLAVRKGLLECAPDCWRPTRRGMDFLNDLQALFLPGQ